MSSFLLIDCSPYLSVFSLFSFFWYAYITYFPRFSERRAIIMKLLWSGEETLSYLKGSSTGIVWGFSSYTPTNDLWRIGVSFLVGRPLCLSVLWFPDENSWKSWQFFNNLRYACVNHKIQVKFDFGPDMVNVKFTVTKIIKTVSGR